MGSKALATPLIRYVSKRSYAAGAAKQAPDARMQQKVLPNKTFIAAMDNGSPVARVTVAFKAGSRYEPSTELGVSHVLRASFGLTTGNINSFILARKLSQIGATLSATGDREFLYYTLEATYDKLPEAMELLNDAVSCQEFRPWDLEDNVPKLKYDIASLSSQVRTVDLLHKAAFRRGLGNSLFISPKRSISSESLQHYATEMLQPNRAAITVVGESLEKASLLAQNLKLSTLNTEIGTEPTKYFGGEMRKEMGGPLAHIALAVPGAPADSPMSMAYAIAAKALGNGPVTKWGADRSALAGAIGNIGPFAAAGFSVSYSDAGLFGVVLTVPKDEAAKAAKSVASLLKKPDLSAKAINAGKQLLKMQVLSEAENGTALSESIAAQGLYTGSAKSPSQLAMEIDQVSDASVSKALQSASSGKLSMAAVGNLAFVPYVDEI